MASWWFCVYWLRVLRSTAVVELQADALAAVRIGDRRGDPGR